MTEYQALNYLVKVPSVESHLEHTFYLPHHGIVKQESGTSKIRVVFNGSSKTTNGTSLNDILHTGAKLQSEIFDVLLYFRRFRFELLTNIKKMFRQILINPDDHRFQRILWVYELGHLTINELTTVTYGTRSAPFLVSRVLDQLVIDEGHRYPLALESMKYGRYVDNISGGADFPEQLLPNN